MAYPYGEVSQSLQNLGQTFERLGGRQMQHKEAMAKLGLQGEQLKGQQAMDKARFEYEQWLDTPMSVRDAILTSPNLARKPEVQRNMLVSVEQPHEGLGGKKIGDIMASPRMLNQVMGEYRQWKISDTARKDTQAFEEGMFGKKTAFEKEMFGLKSDEDWKRLKSSQQHARDMAIANDESAYKRMMGAPNWQIALNEKGDKIGWVDLQNPDRRFIPRGAVGEIGPDGKQLKGGRGGRGGDGGYGIGLEKDEYYKKLADQTVALRMKLAAGGEPDPFDPTKMIPFDPEVRKNMEQLLKNNEDKILSYHKGLGHDPDKWAAVWENAIKGKMETVSKEVDALVEKSKDRSLEEIEQMTFVLQQDDPVFAQMFHEKMRPVTEEKYKQKVKLASMRSRANADPAWMTGEDKIYKAIDEFIPSMETMRGMIPNSANLQRWLPSRENPAGFLGDPKKQAELKALEAEMMKKGILFKKKR